MDELPRIAPRTTSRGFKIYNLDYALPIEYVPSINIQTNINENGDIVVDPSWEDQYREVYAHYHQIEHINKHVDERVYLSIEGIIKFAKSWLGVIGFRNFQEDYVAQHTCLAAHGYGSTYLSIYVYNPYSLCNEPLRPLLYPEDIAYFTNKNKILPTTLQVREISTNIILRSVTL